MPITQMSVDESSVSPRGAREGEYVTLEGTGFGSIAGVVRFDPLVENVEATVVSWAPNAIEFVVPALTTKDRTVTVQVQNVSIDDAATFPFWYPATPSVEPGYQWPDVEAGSPGQDGDDPRKATAADYNRMLDLARVGGLVEGAIVTFDGDATLDDNVAVALVDASVGPVTITLPLAAKTGRRARVIKKIDTSLNAVTVARNGANIEGVAANLALSTALAAAALVCDGAGWWIVSRM